MSQTLLSIVDEATLRQRFRRLSRADLLSSIAQKRDADATQFFGSLPETETQAQFTGLSAVQTFTQALTYLDLCERAAAARGVSFAPEQAVVMDFGCGWGRITQLLRLHFPAERIVAGDVMPRAIELCRNAGISARFTSVPSWPPCKMLDTSVDRITAYSVFSHLAEDNSDAWVREFARILKPGGMAFLTTRHRSFFDYLQSLRLQAGAVPSFARGAARAFEDIDATLAKYDAGEFCFDGQGGGGPGLTTVYGEAAVPAAYAKARWGSHFSSVDYYDPEPAGLLDQATIVLKK